MTASKFNESTCAIIVGAIRKNLTQRLAADYAGVTQRALQEWVQHGRQDIEDQKDTEKARFVRNIKRAKAEAAEECLALIAKSAKHPKRWTANAWLLERVHRSEYSQQGDQFEKLEKMLLEMQERISRMQNRSLNDDKKDQPE